MKHGSKGSTQGRRHEKSKQAISDILTFFKLKNKDTTDGKFILIYILLQQAHMILSWWI